jgi:hypothetical protein
MFTDPTSYIRHRLSPSVQMAVEALFKRDSYGHVVDWSTAAKDMLLSPVPIPLTVRKGLSWKDQLASALGITPLRNQPEVAIRRKIRDWKESSGDPRLIGQVERQSYDAILPSQYADLRQALLDENTGSARDEYLKLAMGQPGQVSKTMKSWSIAPLTGNKANEVRFLRTLDPRDRALYQEARAQRRLVYQRFLALQSGLIPQVRRAPVLR